LYKVIYKNTRSGLFFVGKIMVKWKINISLQKLIAEIEQQKICDFCSLRLMFYYELRF
jgi:hypothetical protein